jgi:hypothetical protein
MTASHFGKCLGGFVLCGLLALAAPATAQIDTGSIVGTVRDASGAVLPGVMVTATQQGTSATAMAVTSERGEYVLPNLRIGRYDIAAEISGFKRGVTRDVSLGVQQRLQVDFGLEVGDISEDVTVEARAEMLQTQRADLGLAVTQRTMTDLPLLGRRYAELAFLAPGVAPAPAGISNRGEESGFNANGNFSTWNNYTLDGADNNSFTTNLQERSVQVVQPPVDALEEFRVQTRTYSAEFGRAAGAVINASIKQGSNSFRGNVYEFFRDEALNANRWENNRAGLEKPAFRQDIFGGTLGGPILRDRTFFFVSYQGTRTDRELTGQATVPTPLMRQGNLSELPIALLETTFAPGCVSTASKTIAASCLDPVAMRIMQLYPQPNIPSAVARQGQPSSFGVPNFINNQTIAEDVDQLDVRVDQNLRAGRDRVFGRYSLADTTRLEEPLLGDPIASGDFNSNNYITGQSAVFGWTRVLGSAMVNELRVSWNNIDSDVLHPAFGSDVNAQFGITGLPTDARYSGGLPHLNIGGLTRIGGPFFRPQFQASSVWQFSNNLSWTRGSHDFKFGVERRRDSVDYIDLAALNGLMTFSNGRYTNSGIGDFLLGLATQQRVTLLHEARLYTDGWQFYGQDAWRLTPTFTLNYGLRYEYFTPMLDRGGLLTNIDPANGQVITAKQDGSVFERALIRPDRNNFAPRTGFAWRTTDRMVVRGGYGVFYQHTDRYGSESQMALNPPQLADVVLQANSRNETPAAVLRNGFVPVSAANIDPARVQWRLQNPEQRTPVVHQFSVGPEYELLRGTVLAVEYVGNRTRNGRRMLNLNQGIIQTPGVGPVVFPYAQYGYGTAFLQQVQTFGRTDYNALQVRLQRRFMRGFAYTAQFTYGRALGDFLDHLSADGSGGGQYPINAYEPDRNYGPLTFDVPRRFTGSFMYELPFGTGRAFDPGGVVGAVVGGWSVNGIVTISDGRPFTVNANDRAATGSGRISVANCVGTAVPKGFNQTIDQWFDTTAFAPTTSFNYGNCGINTVRGPGFSSVNFSAFRSVPMGAARRVELRWEVFNLLNTVNYGLPGSNVDSPGNFGRISSSTGSPREMQLAVKFYF